VTRRNGNLHAELYNNVIEKMHLYGKLFSVGRNKVRRRREGRRREETLYLCYFQYSPFMILQEK
jgi:hypothetical protein